MKPLKKEKNNNAGKVVRPITLKEFNKRIDQSMLDSKNDRLTDNNDLSKEIEHWR